MITARFIERQPNPQLARALIDIMTPEVFIRKADGLERTQDEWGVLWRKRMSETMSWSAVEVVNGSPEADGRHKLYFLQVPPELESPLEAVAWTYGMTGEQYKSLGART
jgi:hypothetical protein